MKKRKGISLIVLIITIIVVIILASIILLSFNRNNPIEKANQAKFKSDVSSFKEELLVTHANNLAENKKYKSESVNVEAGNYSGLKSYIPSITEEYAKVLHITNGELAYVDYDNSNYDPNEASWAREIDIITTASGAEKIYRAPATYYGKSVTNYTSNGVSSWKVFYSDGNNIYLITSDYIELSKLPKKNGKYPRNNSPYSKSAMFLDIINEYTGDVSSLDSKIKALNSDYFNRGYTGSTSGYGWKAVSYLLDKDIWKEFAKGTGADFAVGGPSLELLFNSYCAKYPTKNYKARAFSIDGYMTSITGGSPWNEGIEGCVENSDSLYCTTDTGADTLWLASPSSSATSHVYYLTNSGNVHHKSYAASNNGFRPVVCLKSNILIKDVTGGIEIYE